MVPDSLINQYQVDFVIGRFDQTLEELLLNVSNINLSSYLVEETENHTYRIKSFEQLNRFIAWAGESAFKVSLMALPLDPVEMVINRNTSIPSFQLDQQLTERPGNIMLVTSGDERDTQRVEAVLYNAEAASSGGPFTHNFLRLFKSKPEESVTINSRATPSKCSECEYVGLPQYDAKRLRWTCPNGHLMVYKHE